MRGLVDSGLEGFDEAEQAEQPVMRGLVDSGLGGLEEAEQDEQSAIRGVVVKEELPSPRKWKRKFSSAFNAGVINLSP